MKVRDHSSTGVSAMASPAKLSPRFGYHQLALTILTANGLAILLGGLAGSAAEGTKTLSADEVRDLQSKFKAERAAAETAGLTKKFSPEWFARADGFAARGDAGLTAGHLLE